MRFSIALIALRIPVEWQSWLFFQVEQPDNLVAFQWIAITTLGTFSGGLLLYIRSLLAEIRAMEKERHAHDLAVLERVLTVSQESSDAVRDNTDAVIALSGEPPRGQRARREIRGSGKKAL